MKRHPACRICSLVPAIVAAIFHQGCTHAAFRDALDLPENPANPVEAIATVPVALAAEAGYTAVVLPAAVVGMMVAPFVEVNERERMAIRARNEAAWARPAHVVGSSASLVADELRFHLPRSQGAKTTRDRLSIRVERGGWFGRKTYHIIAVGDFTPERKEAFIEAARRLQGHLEPAPKFQLELIRETEAGRASLGVFEID